MAGAGLTTCLWFDGNGEEAVNYYLSIFKDGKLGRIGRYTEAGPGAAGAVMTVEFELNGQKFLALNGGPGRAFSEAISLMIICADQDEVDYYWSRWLRADRRWPAAGSPTGTGCPGRSSQRCSWT